MKMPEYWILRLFNSENPEITYDEYIRVPVSISFDTMYRNVEHIRQYLKEYAGKLKYISSDNDKVSRIKLISSVISLIYGYENLKNEDYGWEFYDNNKIKSINFCSYYNAIEASYLSNKHVFYYYRPHDIMKEKKGVPDSFTLPEKNQIIDCFDFIQEIYSEKYKAEFPIKKGEWVLKISNFMYVNNERKDAKFVSFPESVSFDKVYKTIGYFQYLNIKSERRQEAKVIKAGKAPKLNLWFALDYIEISNLLVDVLGAKIINEAIYNSPKKEIIREIDLEENWNNAMNLLKNSKDENGYPDYCVPNALKHLYKVKYFYNVIDGNRGKNKYIEMYNKQRKSKKPTLLFKE